MTSIHQPVLLIIISALVLSTACICPFRVRGGGKCLAPGKQFSPNIFLVVKAGNVPASKYVQSIPRVRERVV